jgi:hypothetical protein
MNWEPKAYCISIYNEIWGILYTMERNIIYNFRPNNATISPLAGIEPHVVMHFRCSALTEIQSQLSPDYKFLYIDSCQSAYSCIASSCSRLGLK